MTEKLANVKHYDHEKGYGFALRDSEPRDGELFFHIKGYRREIPHLWGTRWVPISKDMVPAVTEKFALGHKLRILNETKDDRGRGRIDCWTFVEEEPLPYYFIFRIETKRKENEAVADRERKVWVKETVTGTAMIPVVITTDKSQAALWLGEKGYLIYKAHTKEVRGRYGTKVVHALDPIKRAEDL